MAEELRAAEGERRSLRCKQVWWTRVCDNDIGAKETKNEEDVATFNVYGAAAKDPKKTFGDTDK